ncbi:hypothetical protein [Nocardiopsis sp. CNS-639]|uniref:hypothetical protein n=1 Tax=Nocardiopsis sp. CNS-639 TaxID=1169153 RepID=UPI0012DDC160|nr:hypothetical protein [Nocardiopsis sp. CNS-639]
MVVREHGQPGTPMDTTAQQHGATARRGAFFERRAFAAVLAWSESLSKVCHLSRGLVRLDQATGTALDRAGRGLLPRLPEPASAGPRVRTVAPLRPERAALRAAAPWGVDAQT